MATSRELESAYTIIKNEKSNIILHTPHEGVFIPSKYRGSYLIDDILAEAEKFADKNVSNVLLDVNSSKPISKFEGLNVLKFNWSRIVLDVEKYETGDPLEAKGYGPIYTKSLNGDDLRVVSDQDREELIEIYQEYHGALERLTNNVEKEFGDDAIILDLHSFSPTTPLLAKESSVEICLGHNGDDGSIAVVENFKRIFESRGFAVSVNDPFSGSMKPINNLTVRSVMIEINRDLYMDMDLRYKQVDTLNSAVDECLFNINYCEETSGN